MSRVLLVEDDPVLGRGLHVNLELQAYQVEWVRDLKSARLAQSKTPFDLVVLDLGLPDGHGLDFLREIRRATGSTSAVVILTAQTDEDSVVEGLQAGANDYVRKPFGNKELLARIKIALRVPLPDEGQRLRLGELSLLLDQRKLIFGEKEVELHRREFDVLWYLVRHAESVVTREALLTALDKDGEIFDRTIDSHVSHLRTRLKQAGVDAFQISSVYGVGYRLEKR